MAELLQKDQLELHEFSVRYRVASAKQLQTPEKSLEMVREPYGQKWDAKRNTSIESPASEKDREPEEQEP